MTVNKVSAILPDLAPLAWLGNAIETAALWFFGRGAFNLTVHRFRSGSEAVLLTVTTDIEAGPLNFSSAAPISSLVRAQRFPACLANPWEPTKDDQREVTIIQSHGLKQDTTLATLAYGLADNTCDLFKRGAMTVQAQYSLAHCQVRADLGLDDDQLVGFANPAVHSYAAGDYIGILPWSRTIQPKED